MAIPGEGVTRAAAATQAVNITTRAASNRRADLLQAAAVVKGHVTDEDGDPLAEAQVAGLRQTFVQGIATGSRQERRAPTISANTASPEWPRANISLHRRQISEALSRPPTTRLEPYLTPVTSQEFWVVLRLTVNALPREQCVKTEVKRCACVKEIERACNSRRFRLQKISPEPLPAPTAYALGL
ncbi:MAG: hypothetical protein WBV55_21750 [Candidatus Sulfotelmatobacter sp.]